MNQDLGIIDQQTNRVGVISRLNLKTFNPPQPSDTLGRSYINSLTDVGIIDQQSNRVGVIKKNNLQTYNPPQHTTCHKTVMRVEYVPIEYNESNRQLFYQNQKIAGR